MLQNVTKNSQGVESNYLWFCWREREHVPFDVNAVIVHILKELPAEPVTVL